MYFSEKKIWGSLHFKQMSFILFTFCIHFSLCSTFFPQMYRVRTGHGKPGKLWKGMENYSVCGTEIIAGVD